jgi:thioredoxin 1
VKLFRFAIAVLVAAALFGCRGPKKSVQVAAADSTACCPPGTPCASCTGSDTTGAVCDTTLALDSATGTAVAGSAKKPQTQKLKGLPRMWDFGSESCIPCKEMLRILTPMMTEYRDKVDIRIINVYKDKALAKEYRIVTIPTQVFIDAAGKELYRHIGVYPRDSIEAKFREFSMPTVSGAQAPAPAPATGGT